MRASLAEVVDVVALAPALPAATEACSEARELTAQADAGGLEAGASGEGRVNDADGDSGAEELPDGGGVGPGEGQRPLQVFTETTGLRDDWLHRGRALADMDLYQYSIAI